MSIPPSAAYVRTALSPDGTVSLLPGERIVDFSGDYRSGFVVKITGTGPLPKDATSLSVRPPTPPLSPTTAPFPVLPDA